MSYDPPGQPRRHTRRHAHVRRMVVTIVMGCLLGVGLLLAFAYSVLHGR